LPTPSQSYSIPEVARQLLLSPSAISSRLTGIYCKFETLNPNLFQSKKYNKLSTLKLYLYSQYVKVSFLHQLAIPDYAISQLETLELFEFEAEVATITFEPVITDLLSQNLRNFSFETPTVNLRGEIIKTTTHTAQYFSEQLIVNTKQLKTNITEEITLDMVSIPDGTFTMGSPKNEKDSPNNERPQHNVKVPPFFMGKYPITQGQWKMIATRTDLKVKIDLEEDPSYFKKPYQDQDREIDRWLRPVERVNWYEAVEFCQRLSKLTGRDYRLPSEAQWEYACRAMTEPLDLAKGESYPPFYFGETLTDKLANYNASRTYASEPKGENGKETIPVGQFPPNAFGLYDLHGNVWEWCMDDWHDNYENAPSDGSAWLDNNQEENLDAENSLESTEKDGNNPYSVMRGGSWGDNPALCRSAIRSLSFRRDFRDDNLGFRVVCVFGRTL
jgi:formylglycine-generating enzyme required for sulfatase activity